MGVKFIKIGVGNKITISMSKIKNNTANKKNRKENGERALEKDENPHSKGLDVSRFLIKIGEKLVVENKVIRTEGIMIANRKTKVKIIILSFNNG